MERTQSKNPKYGSTLKKGFVVRRMNDVHVSSHSVDYFVVFSGFPRYEDLDHTFALIVDLFERFLIQ